MCGGAEAPGPKGFSELGKSLLGYGIVDFASGAFNEPEQRDLLRARVEWAIRTFESRLPAVRVMLVRPASLEATLRLPIDAVCAPNRQRTHRARYPRGFGHCRGAG